MAVFATLDQLTFRNKGPYLNDKKDQKQNQGEVHLGGRYGCHVAGHSPATR